MPGHPRLNIIHNKQDVDARDKRGHHGKRLTPLQPLLNLTGSASVRAQSTAESLWPMLDVHQNNKKSLADGKLLTSVSERVGVITFNNPEKRNAMSLDMWEGLGQALAEMRDDEEVRVVVLTGAGDKAFMSGADISQFEKTRHNAKAAEEYSRRSEAQRALLANYPKPTIACIRGFCLGGGMQLAMLADIRIAGSSSQFGTPAAKLGIAYGYDGLKHLVSLVGPSWARLLLYTGMRIDSAEAMRIGLVDRVMADAEVWEASFEIARTISTNAPLAIKAAKITIAQVLKDPGERDMEAIKAIGMACMDSEDFREGRQAFMEKRKPQFKGR
jgi:enoyl-CoA hydratase